MLLNSKAFSFSNLFEVIFSWKKYIAFDIKVSTDVMKMKCKVTNYYL